jgi:hypothetical protein
MAVAPEEPESAHLLRTIAELQRQLEHARFQLVLCQGRGEGTFGAWVGSLLPEERPHEDTLLEIASRLRDFEGLRLQAHEGLWLAERIELEDWPAGEDQTAVFIRYLGPERVARELDESCLEELRECYVDDPLFR